MSRLAIAKTYKLYIGGAFLRSESGRVYQVTSTKGAFVANVAKASRKDARDAVVAARSGHAGWAKASGYNRGQVLYRTAELMEGHRVQLISDLVDVEGFSQAAAATQVNRAIDTWVWYAGWADKYAQVAGNANPVAGPFFNLSVPEPTGVVTAIAPQGAAGDKLSSLLGFVSVVAPIIVTGNAVVVIADQTAPLSAISLTEVLEASDVPAGVVNVLTGEPAEMAPWLVEHADVNAIDLCGTQDLDWPSYQIGSIDTLKRVRLPETAAETLVPTVERIGCFTETKTVWHTKSLI